jgi:hypothetical protein
MIGASVEMTSGASRAPVTSQLQVPEERLAKYNQSILVEYVSVEIGRLRNCDGFE